MADGCSITMGDVLMAECEGLDEDDAAFVRREVIGQVLREVVLEGRKCHLYYEGGTQSTVVAHNDDWRCADNLAQFKGALVLDMTTGYPPDDDEMFFVRIITSYGDFTFTQKLTS